MNGSSDARIRIVVRCPGCGAATFNAVDSASDRCPRCGTALVVFGRVLDVEHAVRERLYGRR